MRIIGRRDLPSYIWKALCGARRELPVLRYTKAAISIGFRRDFDEHLSHGLGVEGCAHWSLGGIRAGHLTTDAASAPERTGTKP